MHIASPESLSDEEWLKLYAEYKFTEKLRYEMSVNAYKQALAEIVNQMFSK
ncbi:MAG: hypothetical protein LBN27_05900 [Prevotellaceae bacterium]|jgi:hypothetical protein|nr:hypothetical protein [Prevotellaceae bacterium]